MPVNQTQIMRSELLKEKLIPKSLTCDQVLDEINLSLDVIDTIGSQKFTSLEQFAFYQNIVSSIDRNMRDNISKMGTVCNFSEHLEKLTQVMQKVQTMAEKHGQELK